MAATVARTERAPFERTEHPHVVKSADVLSGEPTVDGTRLAVRHILVYHRDGDSPEEISTEFGLSMAQVHDALSYAFDHLEEIESYIEQNTLRNVMRDQDLLLVGGRGGRLIERRHLESTEMPSSTSVYTWETLPPDVEWSWPSPAFPRGSISTTTFARA